MRMAKAMASSAAGRKITGPQIPRDPENQPADHGTGDTPHSPQNRSAESLEAGQQSHAGIGGVIVNGHHDAGGTAQGGTNKKGQGDHTVDINAHQAGGVLIQGRGDNGFPEFRIFHE